MSVMRVRLDTIIFDAGTQIRAVIDQQVVTDYADAMTEGATFPPIVLFHDGNEHYLADGFHRFMAAQRNAFVDIDADVRAGTKQDALWFALGANKKNGQRLTGSDKRHAIILAFQTWPDMSQNKIAEQIGCAQQYVQRIRIEITPSCNLPDRVTGKDGKSYPASRLTSESKRKMMPDRSKAASAKRRERMREMAVEGYSSRQIAAALELSVEGCRATLRDEHIDVPADRAVGKTKHHDANRIVEQMVMDAEHLTADVNLIDFADLNQARLAAWLRSLQESRDKLGAFIRRLMKEQQKHGEAA